MLRTIFAPTLILLGLLSSGCQQNSNDGLSANGARTHHTVSTTNARAQAYFDEGLTLVYAFNRDQAGTAFRHAAEADPKLAIAYWGQALAGGPNINYPTDDGRRDTGRQALLRAQLPDMHASAMERDLIDALGKRFTANIPDNQKNADYDRAMQAVAQRYPLDNDVQTLAAESVIDNLGSEYLYDVERRPQPRTPALLAKLSSVLERDPHHIGANHLWIHAVDASGHPKLALRSADYLASLTFEPAASHLTHMPSHVYMQLGAWHKIKDGNDLAMSQDEHLARELHVKPITLDYYDHNIDFAIGARLMLGDFRGADALTSRFDGGAQSDVIQYAVFERAWQRILAMPSPGDDATRAVWYYARVLAAIGIGDRATMLESHREYTKLSAMIPTRMKDAAFGVMTDIEKGSVAFATGQTAKGEAAFAAARAVQHAKPYDEVPEWRYPIARQLRDARKATPIAKVGEDQLL